MEEVPVNVYPGLIVPDVLTKQHEHRSGLIWSGNHEMYFTDLQYRHFALRGARQREGALVIVQIWAWWHIPVLWPQLMTDIQADPLAPLGVIWCTFFYCSQLPNDMASEVIQEPPSSPSQIAVFANKVQTIIRRQPSRGAGGGRPPVPPIPGRSDHADPGHVERGEGSGGGHPPVNPFDSPNLDIPSFSLGLSQPSQLLPSGSGTLRAPPPPDLEFAPFQSPAGTSLRFSLFRAPPPPEHSRFIYTVSAYIASIFI
ncbi:hypothetical protein M9H77_35707 [Catharanthus roseus]|uniref:Uncharacterized protein n=1 Tax=Catharanthus roseus TaxID=4058 RepID=A0ACB9ZPR9_CATRO|nr:hypothetical protein M9H77_35707 [Catharanthus roseus]